MYMEDKEKIDGKWQERNIRWKIKMLYKYLTVWLDAGGCVNKRTMHEGDEKI